MRGKTVFHNLFWDLDGSGSDVFTFAYYDGLAADALPTPSTCEDGKPRNDGSIDIDIRIGTPVYDDALSANTEPAYRRMKSSQVGSSPERLTALTDWLPAPRRLKSPKVAVTISTEQADHYTPPTYTTSGSSHPEKFPGR